MKPVVQKVIVSGILLKAGKVLIIQRASDEEDFKDLWELPSGKKEELENVNNALVREFKEETGIDIKVGMPVYVFNYTNEKENEIRDATQINFLVKSVKKNPKIKLSSEHQNYAWMSKEKLNTYNLSKETKKAVLEAYK